MANRMGIDLNAINITTCEYINTLPRLHTGTNGHAQERGGTPTSHPTKTIHTSRQILHKIQNYFFLCLQNVYKTFTKLLVEERF